MEEGVELDLRAICFWFATGFFAENDTFWINVKWDGIDFENQPWKYNPKDISFEESVDKFAALFHSLIRESTLNKKVILPLSGGLDSRTLAAALDYLNIKPYTYSYAFKNSFAESSYGAKIAETCNWEFDAFEIPDDYLWDDIKETAKINHCYTEFTHARQVAVVNEIKNKGDIWLLGHWGDVLFDSSKINSELNESELQNLIRKKIIKKGGFELASELWDTWGLEGTFDSYLDMRLNKMIERIKISNVDAKIRAFKSLYWATRWTSINLSYFESMKPMFLPYYHDEMCEFIMETPEEYLSNRKIQIAYIQKYAPKLAEIPWQDKAPYNLNNYHKHKTIYHLPYRLKNKFVREFKSKILNKKEVVRNWENLFVGEENEKKLESWLFDNSKLKELISEDVVHKYYNLFKKDNQVYWSHSVSMLLTFSVFLSDKKNEL